jgi:hypothetical protein
MAPTIVRHAGDKAHEQTCLVCALRSGVIEFYRRRGRVGQSGAPVVDVSEAIASLVEVAAEFVHRAPTSAEIWRFERYARDCLAAAFRFQVTGVPQPVDTGEPEAKH